MNTLKGTINNLTESGSLTLLSILVENITISAIVIDTPKTASYLKIGKNINVVFKETEVIIVKGTTNGISMRNKFEGIIKSIASKELLSKIILETSAGKITSIITTNAVKQLDLKEGETVSAMVKTNEIMISE